MNHSSTSKYVIMVSEESQKERKKAKCTSENENSLQEREIYSNSFKQYLFFFFNYLLWSVVLVSTVQQSESATHIHISLLFCIPFPFGKEVTTVH